MYDILSQDITYLHGVGPRRGKVLNNDLGIYSLRDLLYYIPYRYVDRSKIYHINELEDGMATIQLIGRIKTIVEEGRGRKKRLEALFDDGTGIIRLVWFNGIVYVKKKLVLNKDFLIFGKPTVFNHEYNVIQPEITELTEKDQLCAVTKLHPVYSITESMRRNGVTSNLLEQMVCGILEKFSTFHIPETLPEYFLKKYNLIGIENALRIIHSPENLELLPQSERRLKFEELFYLQLNILNYAHQKSIKYRGFVFSKVGTFFLRFYHDVLPFELTNAQKKVIKEIRRDVGSGVQMNRLLQGDVGSGKTIVAVMAMLIALDNGFQSCIMAPTEILAEQHYRTVRRLLKSLNVRVELLTGAVLGKRRKDVLEGVGDGEVKILIGTHAIIGDIVNFKNLGLAVVDEQHRFGVEQRAKLWSKNIDPPHILVMTATPIPRTLAMTVYGDLKVSVIDELPPGRKSIKTLHYYNGAIDKLLKLVRNEVQKGHQAYFVYPLIEESEKTDMKNLEEGFGKICEFFPEMKVGKLHGKMKEQEKAEIMERFKNKELDLLVSTTVIEVGVDVPNASVMVIMNAERFGLSQLHQLRGRVGRGAEQSFCVMMTDYKLSEISRKRLEIMVDTTNGFTIAEEDLKLRGPGDMEGTQQSGIIFDLKIANFSKDGDLMEEARNAAVNIIENDPKKDMKQNNVIWEQLALKRKNNKNWSDIS